MADSNVISGTNVATMVIENAQENFSTVEPLTLNNTTGKSVRDGYDLPLLGLAEGTLVSIHAVPLTLIAISFCCGSAILIASFCHRPASTFFKWNKTDRLVIYLALCDWCFNLFHCMDHSQVLITYSQVTPRQLCKFYAFMMIQFIVGQCLLVNLTAIDICVMLFANKRLNFGRWDWRVLTYIIGGPALIGFACLATDQLGFTGVFCLFDPVTGVVASVVCTTALFTVIMVTDVVLYVITWVKLHREAKRHSATLGSNTAGVKATHKAAKNMSMLVLAYRGQWWIMALYGIWQLITIPPLPFYQIVTSFANIGGVLNGIVFIVLRRRMYMDDKAKKTCYSNGESTKRSVEQLDTIACHTLPSKISNNELNKDNENFI